SALAGAFHDVARQPSGAARAFAEMAERFVLGAPRVETGLAADVDHADSVGAETLLRRRPGTLACLRAEPDGVLLFFSGSWLRGPPAAEEPLRFMLAVDAFTPASLPGPLDQESRVVLARRLVHEGFMTIVPD